MVTLAVILCYLHIFLIWKEILFTNVGFKWKDNFVQHLHADQVLCQRSFCTECVESFSSPTHPATHETDRSVFCLFWCVFRNCFNSFPFFI